MAVKTVDNIKNEHENTQKHEAVKVTNNIKN